MKTTEERHGFLRARYENSRQLQLQRPNNRHTDAAITGIRGCLGKLQGAEESKCSKCVNARVLYLHHLAGGGAEEDNTTLSTCSNAAFAALTVTSQLDYASAIDIASCFFHVQGLDISPGPTSVFQKLSYKETEKATENFNTIIGQVGFGTVYKARFSHGSLVAVKRMNKVSGQAEDEFCREIELLARLHHRHLVALRGFCIRKHERFLIISFMNIWQMEA